jgi:hypothetical protein
LELEGSLKNIYLFFPINYYFWNTKNNILKRILPIFFLVIFLFNSLGYFIVFRFNQLEVRNQMRAEILENTPNSRFIKVSVSSSHSPEIVWTDDNEFSYKGKRYDVVRSEKANGSVNYFCLNDSREDALFSQLNENLDNQADANKMANGKSGKLLLKLLAFDYFSTTEQFSFHLVSKSITPCAFIPALSSLQFEITTPPPQIS